MSITFIPINGSTAGLDRARLHRFDEQFMAVTTVGETANDVLAHPDCPKPYQQHPEFSAAYADDVFIDQQEDAPSVYLIEVPYTSLQPGERPEGQDENPLNRRAVIELNSIKERQIVDRDWKGNPLVNTAGDLFVGVEEEEVLWQISITRNVASVPKWLLSYGNAMNEDDVTIRGITYPRFTLKVDGIRIPDSLFENDVEYIPLQLTLVYDQKGWKRKLLNFGLRERLPDQNGEPMNIVVPIKVGNPEEKTEQPVPLDENGFAFRETIEEEIDGQLVPKTVVRQVVDRADIENNLQIYETKPVLPFRSLPLS